MPKLADFGLVRLLDRSQRLTTSGVAIGTPFYMAPEQARGEANIGPALDIYGLGALLYEMLTGSPPFRGANAAETMENVVYKKPIPPSQRRYGCPQRLEAICLRCLKKDPSRRYATAAAVADELRRYLEGPHDSTRPMAVVPVQSGTGRRPWWGAVWSGAGLALLSASLAMVLTWGSVRSQLSELRDQAAQAARSAQRARLEGAIAWCERGQVAHGLNLMKSLPGDPDLPIDRVIGLWEQALLNRVPGDVPYLGRCLAYSPRGDRLAAIDHRGVRLWHSADWSSPLELVYPLEGEATALAWRPDGRALAIGMKDGRILQWLLDSGTQQELRPSRLGKPVLALAYVDQQLTVLAGGDPQPRRIDEEAGKSADLNGSEPWVAAALDPILGSAAAIRMTGAVRWFGSHSRQWHPFPSEGDTTALAWSADGNVLALGTRAGTVRLWDAIGRTPLTDAVTLGSAPITAVSVVAVGKEYLMAASDQERRSGIWRCARPFLTPPVRLAHLPGEEVMGVTFSTDGRLLLVTSPKGISQYRLARSDDPDEYRWNHNYDPANRHSIWYGPARRFRSAAVQGGAWDGRDAVLIGSERGLLFQVHPDRDENLTLAKMADGVDVTALASGPHGRVAALGPAPGRGTLIRHWRRGLSNPPDRDQLLEFVVHHEVFLPDGNALVLGCDDGRVRIWDPDSGRFVQEPIDLQVPILCVAVDQSGQQILAGCLDGTTHLIQRETGRVVQVVRQRAEIRGVAFTGDEFVTASADGSVRRWHIPTGLPLGPVMMHPDAVSALSIWNRFLATGGRERFVRIWRL